MLYIITHTIIIYVQHIYIIYIILVLVHIPYTVYIWKKNSKRYYVNTGIIPGHTISINSVYGIYTCDIYYLFYLRNKTQTEDFAIQEFSNYSCMR